MPEVSEQIFIGNKVIRIVSYGLGPTSGEAFYYLEVWMPRPEWMLPPTVGDSAWRRVSKVPMSLNQLQTLSVFIAEACERIKAL